MCPLFCWEIIANSSQDTVLRLEQHGAHCSTKSNFFQSSDQKSNFFKKHIQTTVPKTTVWNTLTCNKPAFSMSIFQCSQNVPVLVLKMRKTRHSGPLRERGEQRCWHLGSCPQDKKTEEESSNRI